MLKKAYESLTSTYGGAEAMENTKQEQFKEAAKRVILKIDEAGRWWPWIAKRGTVV